MTKNNNTTEKMTNNVKLKDIADIFVGVSINNYCIPKFHGKMKEQEVYMQKIGRNKGTYLKKRYVSEDLDSQYYTKKDDIVFKLGSPNNANKIEKDGIIITSRFAIIRPHKGTNPNYLTHLLNSDLIKAELNKCIEDEKLAEIKMKDLNDLLLPIPSLELQEIAAPYISSVDSEAELENILMEQEKKLE